MNMIFIEMIFKYFYPVLIRENSVITDANHYYRVRKSFYAIFVDISTIDDELGSMVGDLAHALFSGDDPMDKDMAFDVRAHNNYIEYIYDIPKSHVEKIDEHITPIFIDIATDRYFNVGDRYIRATQSSVELMSNQCCQDKNIVNLPSFMEYWPLSLYEYIIPVTIPKGTFFNDECGNVLKTICNTSIFYIDTIIMNALCKELTPDVYQWDNIPHATSFTIDEENGYPSIYYMNTTHTELYCTSAGRYGYRLWPYQVPKYYMRQNDGTCSYQMGKYTIQFHTHVCTCYKVSINITYVDTLYKRCPLHYVDITMC